MASTQIVHRNRLPPLPTIRDLIKLYKLRALRQLSQNFLLDERITDKIVRAAGRLENNYVCEVGPGPGSITRSILRQNPKELLVIEKDPRFLPILEHLSEATNGLPKLSIIVGDIMSHNLEKSFPDAPRHEWTTVPPPVHIIGNLPFSVSTHLIIRWMNAISKQEHAWTYGRTRMTLTFQKEVAERICAPIMSSQRCRLSVMCQLWSKVEHAFTIPGKAFVPKPDVDVGVVVFTPLKKPMTDLPFELVEKVLRHMFNMRQKYVLRGGSNLFPEELRDELSERLFLLADVDPKARPFQITNSEFVRLCCAYTGICKEYPEIVNYDYRGPKKKSVDAVFL